jgi:hypothetical protein
LEGFWRLNIINGNSDKSSQKALLSANGFSCLSEQGSVGWLAALAGIYYGYRIGLFEGGPFPTGVFAESVAQASAAAGVSP